MTRAEERPEVHLQRPDRQTWLRPQSRLSHGYHGTNTNQRVPWPRHARWYEGPKGWECDTVELTLLKASTNPSGASGTAKGLCRPRSVYSPCPLLLGTQVASDVLI